MKTLRIAVLFILLSSCSDDKYCPCQNYGGYWFANCEDDVVNRLISEQPDDKYMEALVYKHPCTDEND